MRNIKPTAQSLAADRDRGWAKIQDQNKNHDILMLWDGEKRDINEAVFRLKIDCHCGSHKCKGIDVAISKFEFNRSARWV